ncbi:uncharacterized protein [Montipora capricornis]|uniref:uncharacterized protein n=1 Tax=Montipora capricornis TaxID=246305 RepID=UPI0035F10F60
MKTGVIVLLLVAISLLASVESHNRGNKRGGGKRKAYSGGKRSWMKTICNNQERPKNCSEFDSENKKCIACDDGFALKDMRMCDKAICVSCRSRYLRSKYNALYRSQCGCGQGCANCTESGLCAQCESGWAFPTSPNSNFTGCVKEKKCPPFLKRVNDSPSARCQRLKPKPQNTTCGVSFCDKCSEEGICLSCKEPRKLITMGNRAICVRCPSPLKGLCNRNKGPQISSKGPRKGDKKSIMSDVSDTFQKIKSAARKIFRG